MIIHEDIFINCLPVMLQAKAINQHYTYALFQIKQSVTHSLSQNVEENDRFCFSVLQMISEF